MKAEELKDITGFERYLHKDGFKLANCKANYLNTYTCPMREWSKENKYITIGLVDSPIRVGLPFAPIINDKDYSFMPSEHEYEHYKNTVS